MLARIVIHVGTLTFTVRASGARGEGATDAMRAAAGPTLSRFAGGSWAGTNHAHVPN